MINDRLRGRLRDNALTDKDVEELLLILNDLEYDSETLGKINDRLEAAIETYKRALDAMVAAYMAVRGEAED